MAPNDKLGVLAYRGWIALFVLIAIAIAIGGYGYNSLATAMVRKEAIDRLSGVAELKVDLIHQWRTERLNDAYRSASAPYFRAAFEEWSRNADGEPAPPAFREHLSLETLAHGYANAFLLDEDGSVLVSASGAALPTGPETRSAIDLAAATRRAIMTDFFRTEDGGGPFVDTVAAIPGSDGPLLAYLVLRSDPVDFLFPILEKWPTLSESAEATLVSREGEEVVFLNAPRFSDADVMTMRLPLADKIHPAVQAVSGVEGIVEGMDYRHERVLADLHPVQGTPWFLVTKVDSSELLAEARYRMWVAGIIAALCVLLSGVAIVYIYRLRQLNLYEKLLAAEKKERAVLEEMRESEERFRMLYERAAVGILIHDAETGEIVDANPKAITDYGLETLEELQAYDIWLEPPYSLDDAHRVIRRSFEEGPQRSEWKSRDVHGREFWEEVSTFVMKLDGVDRVVSVALNITARKQTENALAKSQSEIARFFDVSPDLLCIADAESIFLKLNKAWEDALGYPLDEMLGRSFMDFVHPDDREVTLAEAQRLADRQPVDGFVNRYRAADGSYRFIEWRCTCPDGNLIYAAARDITARKEAELERQRLLFLLNEAEKIARLGAWEMDATTNESTWTDEVYAIHELDRGKLPDLTMALGFYHPEDRPAVGAAVQACIVSHRPFELVCRLVTAKGNLRWVRASGKPIVENGKVVRLVGLLQDITEQRLAEDALQRELEFSRQIVDNMADGFVLLDGEGVTVDANAAFCEMTGLSRKELVGTRPPYEYWPPEELDTIQAAFHETLALQPRTFELIFRRKNGERFPALISPSYLLDSQGKVLNYFATVKDMTESVRAVQERERLMSAIEQSSESILITDIKGTIQYVNPAFERITGYTREEALGDNPSLLKSGEQGEDFYRELWEAITAGETWHGRLRNKRKDGSLFTEDATISPVRDPAGNIVSFVAVKRDIGREEELEGQLRQSQKMDAVGRLAGGIAHDFNNMLGVILGHTEMALEQAEVESPLYDDLLQIQVAGKRSADLTRQLLSFARRQAIAPRQVDLNKAIGSTLSMLKRLIGEDIEIAWLPDPDLASIKMDTSQLDQIIMNLSVNARDAIGPEGGRITIATHNEVIDESTAALYPDATPGRYAVLSISDTGCGMDAYTVEHLFEPFFTTKEMGRGTGLGLATVYGIVKQNGGYITVNSKPGAGASFRVYLPGQEDRILPKKEGVAEAIEHILSGGETILLVEDEAPLLAVNTRFLERMGYTVLPAPGPMEALEIAGRNGQEIDLLLTDVVMPGMTGREVWETLHGERPNLKCLFVSGYTADIMADHGVMNEAVHFLQKPFTMKDLAAKVREVLGKGVESDSVSP